MRSGAPLAPGRSRASEIEDLKRKVVRLEQRLARLERCRSSLSVPINTFTPEPYELMSPLFVAVEIEDDQFIATFFDANISASGDTEEEAVGNLKSLILDTFESLSAEDTTLLGPEPRRQLAVLQSFLRPIPS
jgi:predicted RNase H-like HicB family nuclease